MPKKKTKAKAKQQATTQAQPSSSTILQITAEELQNIIANALVQAEEQRKQNEKDNQERERQEWRKAIGYKDYSKSNSKFAGILGFLNGIQCGIKMMFMSSAKIKGYKTISASLSMGLSNNYLMAALMSFILSLCILILTVAFIVVNLLPWYIALLLFILSLGLFINVLKNRLAYFEVTYIKDDNLILNILASHNSKISIIIAIISAAIAVMAIVK